MSSLAVSIPNGWTWKTVGEFTTEHKQGYYTKESYVSNGIFLIRITDLGNPKIEYSNMPKLEIDNKEFKQFKVDIGDFLFARSGAIGRYGIVTSDLAAVFASYLIRFRFNDQLVITRYFGYLYESDLCQKQLASITQGSSNININAENIKSLLVPFAPLPEQQKIAAILTSVDDVIESTQAQINKLKDLKIGMMQELLTKGIGHAEFKDSAVGRIPKAWEVVNLNSLSNLITKGTTPTSLGFQYQDSGINFIKVESIIRNGVIDTNKFSFIGDDANKALARSVIHSGDILITIAGATVGKLAMVDERHIPANTNQALAIIRLDTKKVKRHFVYYWLQSGYIVSEVANIQTVGAQPNLSLAQIGNMNVALPSVDEQNKIVFALTGLDSKIDLFSKKLAIVSSIKKALMQDLLTGKVRVKVS